MWRDGGQGYWVVGGAVDLGGEDAAHELYCVVHDPVHLGRGEIEYVE